MDLHHLTIKKFHAGLLKKEFTALEVAEAYFRHIEERDKEIGAYLTLMKDEALRQAEAADLALARGEAISPLSGVPIAVKDNILIKDHRATAGSRILENYVSAYDATAIAKLRAKGVVFLGKTNLDEFAMGSSTENSAFQKTKHPLDHTRVPGGSSGGSVAAVAANMALGALGSETGGSVRQPSSFCGVVGLKTTYGSVSRFGLMAMASSLDQIGPIAKTAEDTALLFKAIAGRDRYDSTSSEPSHGYGEELLNPKLDDIKKLKIGLPKEYFAVSAEAFGGGGSGLDPEVAKKIDEAVAALKSLGLQFKEISLPHTRYAISCYYIIMPAEVSANLARYEGIRFAETKNKKLKTKNLLDVYLKTRSDGFGEEVKRRIILGTFVLSSGYYDEYYAKAQKVRRLIKEDFDRAFKEVDVILTPVAPTPAFKLGEKINDPLTMYLSDIFTIPANLAGLPAISIPVTPDTRHPIPDLPVGFQLIGKHWREADILGIGQFYERLNNH